LREAWRQRRRLYAGLGVTWLVLAGLVFHTGTRGGTAGYGVGVAWWAYALSQLPAITHYLQLAVWPHPLVLDYGTDLAQPTAEILPFALIVAALAAGMVIALRRQPAFGYAGVWFFAILAPTSSVVPVATQTMAEHRMYLPLAAAIFLALAIGLSWLTVRRNEDYHSDLSLWRDTVAKCPHNARAHFTLGNVLYRLDRVPEAMRQYEAALDIAPNHAEAHNSLGNILVRLGRLPEAMAHYERALQLEPDYIQADYNYGNALVQAGRLPEAMSHYHQALRLDPQNAEVRNNLGSALLLAGRLPEATGQLQEALRIKPDYAEAHYNLANALAQSGQLPEAISHYEQALQIKPDYMEARENLARVQALQRAALPKN
jgi:tetratricopeptide (TPR) repeat protein